MATVRYPCPCMSLTDKVQSAGSYQATVVRVRSCPSLVFALVATRDGSALSECTLAGYIIFPLIFLDFSTRHAKTLGNHGVYDHVGDELDDRYSGVRWSETRHFRSAEISQGFPAGTLHGELCPSDTAGHGGSASRLQSRRWRRRTILL